MQTQDFTTRLETNLKNIQLLKDIIASEPGVELQEEDLTLEEMRWCSVEGDFELAFNAKPSSKEEGHGTLEIDVYLCIWDEKDCFIQLTWDESAQSWIAGWERASKTKLPAAWLAALIKDCGLTRPNRYRKVAPEEIITLARKCVRAYRDSLLN